MAVKICYTIAVGLFLCLAGAQLSGQSELNILSDTAQYQAEA